MKKPLALIVILISLSSHAQKSVGAYQKIVAEYVAKKRFSGNVLITKQGQTVFQSASGIANRTWNIPMTMDAKFKICSITKTFTTVLVMQLVEAGKLKLDGTIGQYLPEYKGPAKDQVTIEQLLTYSSGLDNADQRNDAMYQSLVPVDSIINKFGSGSLLSKPGTQFSYKNIDFIILGRILEKVSGKPYSVLLQQQILGPLQMKHSGYLTNSMVIPGLVSSYQVDSLGHYQQDDPYWIDNFFASAAMYASIKDMQLFDQALFQAKLIKKSSLDLMLKPHPELWGVALGFWVSDAQIGSIKTRVADRRGSIGGSNAIWYHLIDKDLNIFILSNNNAFDLVELRDALAKQALN
jgi:CubicO group peptidase (beta-lactamase class C family)